MLSRSSLLRSALRATPSSNFTAAASVARNGNSIIQRAALTSASRPALRNGLLSKNLALTAHKPTATALVRYFSEGNALQDVDLSKKKLTPHPERVSVDSSVRPIVGHEVGGPEEEPQTDMMKNIYSDMDTIRETFTLEEVPKQALVIGLAGVLPYLATSASTVFLASEINTALASGSGYLFSHETAELLLNVVSPIQVGYGAVILSFLGAIHWGLEWAGYGGTQGYRRYMIGVAAPAVAWPTIFLPTQAALITQFLAFTFLYNTDARASARGWAPHWYGIYRFVLTFIVGASLVASLIAHGHIHGYVAKGSATGEKLKQLRAIQAGEQEQEETETRNNIAEKEEAEEDEE